MAGDTKEVTFNSVEEELEHWKTIAQEAQDEVAELEEFMESSRDIERAMEKEVQDYEARLKDVTGMYNRFKDKTEQKEAKYKAVRQELLTRVDAVNTDLDSERSHVELLLKRTQELEQENDDLSRTNRELEATGKETAQQLESALVETAGLQSDIEAMSEANERLKESLSEAKSELAANAKRIQQLILAQTDENCDISTFSKDPSPSGMAFGVTLSDFAAESPLSLVDEMLLLVKNLEIRLAKCKGDSSS